LTAVLFASTLLCVLLKSHPSSLSGLDERKEALEEQPVSIARYALRDKNPFSYD
jgi:hypothetical protein